MPDVTEALRLTRRALEEFDSVPLAVSIRRAERIARLRGDFNALWWLALEHGGFDHGHLMRSELAAHYSEEAYKRLHEYFRERWIREHSVQQYDAMGVEPPKEMVDASSVGFVEAKITYMQKVDEFESAQGNSQLVIWARLTRLDLIRILEDIRVRAHDFLARTEAQLIAGERPDILVRAREYVLETLRSLSPQASEQLLEAETAVFEGTPERLSHAVTSCRRALKTLADAVYPPHEEPVVGADGVERNLDEEHFISRLWQFAYDQGGTSRAGELLRATIEGLGARLDAVYGATNKGVHSTVSEREADQFVTQTFMLFADLLRLRDETSAVDIEVSDLPQTTPPVVPT